MEDHAENTDRKQPEQFRSPDRGVGQWRVKEGQYQDPEKGREALRSLWTVDTRPRQAVAFVEVSRVVKADERIVHHVRQDRKQLNERRGQNQCADDERRRVVAEPATLGA